MTSPLRASADNAAPDVLVWGGGSGGIAAALQAARAGARTLLLTPGAWLGGMVSAAGVCAPDGNELTPWQSGLWGALLRSLARAEPGGLDHNWVSCFGYRPATAETILRRWLRDELLLGWWPLCRLLAVERRADRIVAVTVERQGEAQRLRPRLVIDGSDRGDLFPLAEAGFRLGWEPRELWQEPSAPPAADLARDPFYQRQPVQSPTWVAFAQLAEPAAGESLAAAPAVLPPVTGSLSGPEPVLPAPFAGAATAFGLERTLTYGRLPGGLVMLNWPLHGNDWHRGLERAFGGDAAAERELEQEMQHHSLAFAAALTGVAADRLSLAQAMPSPEQAADGALNGSGCLALMPYWREGRRLVGLDLVVEQQLLPAGAGACRAPLPLDSEGRCSSIAVGNYANDHHYPGPDWPLAPKSCRWGGRWSGTPFCVPYGALVSATVVNLLAADKCFSVSHMANGATRLQPLVLNLGQAAGMAAALCVREGLDPAQLPVRRLQEALLADPLAPAAPLPLWDTPWHHPQWRERQRRALDDPSLLGRNGELVGADAGDPRRAPAESGERLLRGELIPDGDGGYALVPERAEPAGASRVAAKAASWPLITLEPALHRWLQAVERPTPVALIGCLNPWGPWLRASRLAE